jgi:hypothetical protein
VSQYSIFVNAKYDSIQQRYVWPSNGEPVTQYPHTYDYFNNHYSGNTYRWRTTPLWILSIPNSNSYFQSFENDVKSNSVLCLKKDLFKLPSNPCSTTNQVNNTYWFGSLISCERNVYSLDFAQTHCPKGQVLAEITDASLFKNITDAISIRNKYFLYFIVVFIYYVF